MPKPLTQDTLVGDVRHGWTIQEYDTHERGVLWHIIMISIGLILVLYGLISSNFLFSLIIILAAIILFLQSHQDPLQVPFQITDLGIIVGAKFYTYSELESFYIIYDPPEVKTLFIETAGLFRPMLRIPLLDENPIEIRRTLGEFLEEDLDKEEEPRSDAAARRWKIH